MDEVASNIGDAAGYVYRLLVEGKANISKVKRTLKKTGFDSETVLMAIDWLAREDKLLIEKNGDNCTIKLK
ncbi:winged helix-turn-helix domain-containing protein [uncultured Methanomethylovorans sp.]|uniref:winged helix-turn-helix domain-containing protein n=1 Tax=uncultured Methanomethylovorans sp. TaxID=183759 RepID=UPI00261E5F87|nr:winged helix-turn-helix domain-containing protein [uncultured Methanomethylovorans sp.]